MYVLSKIIKNIKIFPVTFSIFKAEKTRIVRGSDYSPASELFARERQTMTGNNAKLDLVNVDAHKKIGQILTICS